jgi:DNA-binding transcriptional regulator YhcF (GntR family)
VSGLPEYRQAANVIMDKITTGELNPTETLTIREVADLTGVKYGTARTAAEWLESQGILEGQQGRGFEIVATPKQAAGKRADIDTVSKQLAELRQEVDDLRKRVGRMAATLATVAKKPRGGKREQAEAAADGGRR